MNALRIKSLLLSGVGIYLITIGIISVVFFSLDYNGNLSLQMSASMDPATLNTIKTVLYIVLFPHIPFESILAYFGNAYQIVVFPIGSFVISILFALIGIPFAYFGLKGSKKDRKK